MIICPFFKDRQAAHRLFLAYFATKEMREELLALRQDVDEALGYCETIQYFKERGIQIVKVTP